MSTYPPRKFGEIKCCNCSKIISKKSPNQVRCLACAMVYEPVFNPKFILTCQNCNTKFDAYKCDQKYCKISCKNEHDNKKANEKWIKKEKIKKGVKIWMAN